MKQRKYFVVAIGGSGLPLAIMRGDDETIEEIALYDTRREAASMAERQPLCAARGYHVYEWDYCE